MKRWSRLAAATSAVATVAVLPASASALTKTVSAGPPQSAQGQAVHQLGKKFLQHYSPEVTQFFRKRITINQGDSVKFVFGGFHTIDLPGPSNEDLPYILRGKTVHGVKDPAGKLFWFNGREPSLGLNPALFAPIGTATYDGSSRVDSGLPAGNGPPKPFTVSFTKPGVYKYFCDIHPGMVGYVVVKPTGHSIPSAAQDKATVQKQVNTDIAALKKVAKRKIPHDQISVGDSDGKGDEFLAMVPDVLKVKKGTVVKFAMAPGSNEIHTATFGPVRFLKKLSNAFFGPPRATQEGAYPSSPKQPIPESPGSHGNGFANVGLIDTDSGTKFIPASGKIEFLAPGVYHFICLIHNNMHGTIIVTK
jgi:plastocyanin